MGAESVRQRGGEEQAREHHAGEDRARAAGDAGSNQLAIQVV